MSCGNLDEAAFGVDHHGFVVAAACDPGIWGDYRIAKTTLIN